MIRILAVGKRHEHWVLDGVLRYEKRLKKPFDTEWVLIQHSAYENDKARQEESERILSRLSSNDYVILLDERGKNISSPDLSSLLSSQLPSRRQVVVIIGGAYGVDEHLLKRADFVWSLSLLVFPHQMIRLMLVEQIYRAQEIHASSPYHHI